MSHALGIDFGTSNSSASIVDSRGLRTLPVDESSIDPRVMKSVIYLNPDHEYAVGSKAIENYLHDIETIPATYPKLVKTGRILTLIKASSGGGFGGVEKVEEIVEMDTSGRGRLLQSLKSVLTSDMYKGTEVFGRFYELEEILAMLLGTIRSESEKSLGFPVDKAVIGRPVRYVGSKTGEQLALSRMEKIAQKAGFKEVVFEYEPVGAALNFGIDLKTNNKVFVFDFGGGTLDTCIMDFSDRQVLSVDGRPIGGDLLTSLIFMSKLGKYFGKDSTFNNGLSPMPTQFMHSLMNWYSITRLKTRKYLDSLESLSRTTDQPETIRNLTELVMEDYGYRLYQEVDRAKRALSDQNEDVIKFVGKSLVIDEHITRSEFELIIQQEISETLRLIDETLKNAELSVDEIDQVITTGGSSLIPCFRGILTSYFGESKVMFGESFMGVSRGLAIKAQQLFR